MKLKITLSIIIISSFILLQSFAFTADDSSVNDGDTEALVLPPLDILLVIDVSGVIMYEQKRRKVVNPEERDRFESFKQIIVNTKWEKPRFRVRFLLDENNRLICYQSMVDSPVDCTELINQAFPLIERAKEQDLLTVRSSEKIVKDFVLQNLKNIRTVEKMKVNMKQFMKENRLNSLVIIITNLDAQD